MSKVKSVQKSLAKNSFFNVLYRVINMLFPLVTAMYVSHILLAKGIGKVSAAQNVVQYFVLLAPLGLTNYGTREIAKIRNNKELTNRLFTELFIINFCSTLICSVAYYSMIILNDFFYTERSLYLISGLPILFNFINVEWFYEGNEEYVYIALRNIFVKIVSVITIILFVRSANDYLIYALIYTLGIAGNYIFNIVNLIKRGIHFDISNLSFLRHLAPIFILLCSNVAVELYTLLDTTMLNIMCSNEIVGYYTNSIKIVKMIVSLIAAIGGVLLPRLSYYRSQRQYAECDRLISSITKVMLFFTIPCGIGIFLVADKLVLLMFGASFLPAVMTVKIGSLIIYVLGFSNLFGTQVLLTYNQEKKLLICTCVGAFSNIIMNSFMIPRYQQNGAIIASVISESIVTCMTILFAKNYVKINVTVNYWLKVIGAGVGMGAIVLFITKIVNNSILCVVLSVVIGSCVYFILNLIFRNELILKVSTIMKKRMQR